jgi:hypothetical protein
MNGDMSSKDFFTSRPVTTKVSSNKFDFYQRSMVKIEEVTTDKPINMFCDYCEKDVHTECRS